MAEIKAAINIIDGFTPAFNALSSALNMAMSEIASLQAQLGKNVDLTGINAARAELDRANQALKDMTGPDLSGTAADLKTAAKAASSLGNAADSTTADLNRTTKAAQRTASATADINGSSLNSTAQAANKTSSALNGVASAANNAGAAGASAGARIASADLDAASAANRAAAAQSAVTTELNQSESAASALLARIQALGLGYLALQGVGSVVRASDSLTNANARVALINDGSQSQEELQDKIFNAAQRSYSAYQNMAAVVARINMNAGDAFKTNDEAIKFAEILTKKFSIAGASAEEMASATLQLTQALGSGVLRGEELNSVFEAAPNVIQSIADYLKQPIGKIRDLASEGKLSATIVKNAMFAAAEETNKQFNSMPVTFEAMWTYIKNYALKAFTPVLKMINDLWNSSDFQQFVQAMVGGMAKAAQAIVWVFQQLTNLYTFVKTNFDTLAPIFLTIAAAVGVWTASLIAAKIAALAHVAANAILTASIIAFTFATQGATAGFAALNAVMALNPFTLVLLAIIAVIAAFYGVVALINHFCDTSISATGLVAGAFRGLFAAIWNLVAVAWNGFSKFAEFIINVFSNPLYSVQALFLNLISAILTALGTLTSAFDELATNIANAFIWAFNAVISAWNSFVNFLPDSIAEKLGLESADKIEASTSITSDIGDAQKAVQDMIAANKPADYTNLPTLDYKNVWKEIEAGYNAGDQLTKDFSVSDVMSKALNEGKGLADSLTSETSKADLTVANDTLKAIAGNTAATTNAITANSDELKFLREIGEREAIYKLNTNEIKVDMTNNNTISNPLDIEAVMDSLANSLRDNMGAMAEGTHE